MNNDLQILTNNGVLELNQWILNTESREFNKTLIVQVLEIKFYNETLPIYKCYITDSVYKLIVLIIHNSNSGKIEENDIIKISKITSGSTNTSSGKMAVIKSYEKLFINSREDDLELSPTDMKLILSEIQRETYLEEASKINSNNNYQNNMILNNLKKGLNSFLIPQALKKQQNLNENEDKRQISSLNQNSNINTLKIDTINMNTINKNKLINKFNTKYLKENNENENNLLQHQNKNLNLNLNSDQYLNCSMDRLNNDFNTNDKFTIKENYSYLNGKIKLNDKAQNDNFKNFEENGFNENITKFKKNNICQDISFNFKDYDDVGFSGKKIDKTSKIPRFESSKIIYEEDEVIDLLEQEDLDINSNKNFESQIDKKFLKNNNLINQNKSDFFNKDKPNIKIDQNLIRINKPKNEIFYEYEKNIHNNRETNIHSKNHPISSEFLVSNERNICIDEALDFRKFNENEIPQSNNYQKVNYPINNNINPNFHNFNNNNGYAQNENNFYLAQSSFIISQQNSKPCNDLSKDNCNISSNNNTNNDKRYVINNSKIQISNFSDYPKEFKYKQNYKNTKNSINNINNNKFSQNNFLTDDLTMDEKFKYLISMKKPDPIKSLTTLSTQVFLRVRCLYKSEKRSYQNNTKKVFNFNVIDSAGSEMPITCFDPTCDNFYDLIEVNGLYEIFGGYLKINDKKFTRVNSVFKLYLDERTIIRKIQENSVNEFIPTQKYNFIKIESIARLPLNKIIDLLCYVLEIKETKNILSKKSNKNTVLKVLKVTDDTFYKIDINIWGTFANQDYYPGQILAIRYVKVGEFKGRNLSVCDSVSMQLKPNFAEAIEMKNKVENYTQEFKELPNYIDEIYGLQSDNGLKIIQIGDLVSCLDKLSVENITFADCIVKGSVVQFLHSDKNFYSGCPVCKKKLNLEENNYCVKCNQNYEKPVNYFHINFLIKDQTGELNLDVLGENAENILGIKCDIYKELYENNNDGKLFEISKSIEFQTFYFTLVPRITIIDNIRSKKFTCVKFSKIEIDEHISSEIEQYKKQINEKSINNNSNLCNEKNHYSIREAEEISRDYKYSEIRNSEEFLHKRNDSNDKNNAINLDTILNNQKIIAKENKSDNYLNEDDSLNIEIDINENFSDIQ